MKRASALTLSLALALGFTGPAAIAAETASAVLEVEESPRPAHETLLHVAQTLGALRGIESVHLRIARREVRVSYDTAAVGVPEIVAALERAGFRAHRKEPLPGSPATTEGAH